MQNDLKRQQLSDSLELERQEFAAKLRCSRAILGWSQTEFAAHVGVTQRSIHLIEQGGTEPRRGTMLAIEQVWAEQGLIFEALQGGGFKLVIRPSVLLPNCNGPNTQPDYSHAHIHEPVLT